MNLLFLPLPGSAAQGGQLRSTVLPPTCIGDKGQEIQRQD